MGKCKKVILAVNMLNIPKTGKKDIRLAASKTLNIQNATGLNYILEEERGSCFRLTDWSI